MTKRFIDQHIVVNDEIVGPIQYVGTVNSLFFILQLFLNWELQRVKALLSINLLAVN